MDEARSIVFGAGGGNKNVLFWNILSCARSSSKQSIAFCHEETKIMGNGRFEHLSWVTIFLKSPAVYSNSAIQQPIR